MKNILNFFLVITSLPSLFTSAENFSLPSSNIDFAMGSNGSGSELETRQPNQFYPIIHCGDGVKLVPSKRLSGSSRTCTLGFAVKRSKVGRGAFNNGYLTLGSCVPSYVSKTTGMSYNVYNSKNSVIGKTYNSEVNMRYDPAEGLDYNIIRIIEPKVLSDLSAGISNNSPNQPLVIKTLNPITPAKEAPVCFSGSYSGLVCGELVLTNSEFTRTDPWPNSFFLPQMDNFLQMGVVGLVLPSCNPLLGRCSEDYGAPVFVPVYSCENPKQIVAAHPVGLLMHQSLSPFVITEFRGMVPHAKLIPFSFYYQPLSLIFAKEPNLGLIISPKGLDQAEGKCS